MIGPRWDVQWMRLDLRGLTGQDVLAKYLREGWEVVATDTSDASNTHVCLKRERGWWERWRTRNDPAHTGQGRAVYR
jgi:hypothetical protein